MTGDQVGMAHPKGLDVQGELEMVKKAAEKAHQSCCR